MDDSSELSLMQYGADPEERLPGGGGGGAGGAGWTEEAAQLVNQEDLLEYYRKRCDEFDKERELLLGRFGELEVRHEELHKLRWSLRVKDDEVAQLQAALSEVNFVVLREREQVLQLQAENERLRIEELEDRRRIQHLLALTQPVTQEVTFVRDRRPGKMTTFPAGHPGQEPLADKAALYRQMDDMERARLQQESGGAAPESGSGSGSGSSQGGEDAAMPPPPPSTSGGGSSSRVLRTVYLPNERANSLMQTIRSLEQQMAQQRKVAEDEIEALKEDRRTTRHEADERVAGLRQERDELANKVQSMEFKLRQTTRDYLVLRHNAQRAQREAGELRVTARETETQMHTQVSDVAERANKEAAAVRAAAKEEARLFAQEFRAQAIAREEDLCVLKEQYAHVQQLYEARIKDLEERLAAVRKRHSDLEKRRRLELEGFTTDITTLRRTLERLEAAPGNGSVASGSSSGKARRRRGSRSRLGGRGAAPPSAAAVNRGLSDLKARVGAL